MKPKAATTVYDPWDGSGHMMTDQCHESERDSHSKLLGPDGQPLRYERLKMGFDLSPRSTK